MMFKLRELFCGTGELPQGKALRRMEGCLERDFSDILRSNRGTVAT